MKSKLLVIAVRKTVVVFTVGLVLLFSISHASAANIVINGSFEDPDIPFGSFNIFDAIPGWALAFGCGIEIQDHSAGSPHTGGQLVELDSSCSSGIYQDLTTTPGQLYDLGFAYSPRPGVFDNRIRVMWDDGVIQDLQGNGVGLGDTAWEVHDITCLSADSADATRRLEFDDTSGFPFSFGGYIDSVSVEEHAGTGCISNTAVIDSTAIVAADATIGAGAVIQADATVDSGASVGERAVVGERTAVRQYAAVGADTQIASDSTIGKSAATGSEAVIGPYVAVGSDATIGVLGDAEVQAGAVVADETSLAAGSKIWRGVEMGRNVTVGAEAEVGVVPDGQGLIAQSIEPSATTVVADETSLGARSRIWAGANIGPRVRMETRAVVGVNATLAEDVAMGADSTVKDGADIRARVRIGKGATVGLNATVGADTTMGAQSAVGDCAVVPQGTIIKRGDTTTWASSCP